MKKLSLTGKGAHGIQTKQFGFPHAPKEFFCSFWFPILDKAKDLGLTDAEAEHTTGIILSALFRGGDLDSRIPLNDLMLGLIQASAWIELSRRRSERRHEGATIPALVPGADYYSLPLKFASAFSKNCGAFWRNSRAATSGNRLRHETQTRHFRRFTRELLPGWGFRAAGSRDPRVPLFVSGKGAVVTEN